jgi:hypothetical protein
MGEILRGETAGGLGKLWAFYRLRAPSSVFNVRAIKPEARELPEPLKVSLWRKELEHPPAV